MEVTAVESTTLTTVAYDPARRWLQLEFRDRTKYRYFGVPAGVHEGLLKAASKASSIKFPKRKKAVDTL
jgi:hypothetical protein